MYQYSPSCGWKKEFNSFTSDGHLDCLYFGAIMNNATMNTSIQVFKWRFFKIFFQLEENCLTVVLVSVIQKANQSWRYFKRFLEHFQFYNKIGREVQRFSIYSLPAHMHYLSLSIITYQHGTFSPRMNLHWYSIIIQVNALSLLVWILQVWAKVYI